MCPGEVGGVAAELRHLAVPALWNIYKNCLKKGDKRSCPIVAYLRTGLNKCYLLDMISFCGLKSSNASVNFKTKTGAEARAEKLGAWAEAAESKLEQQSRSWWGEAEVGAGRIEAGAAEP